MTTSHKELRSIDRKDAGRQLARQLLSYIKQDVVAYVLPQGGVVTGVEIALVLKSPT